MNVQLTLWLRQSDHVQSNGSGYPIPTTLVILQPFQNLQIDPPPPIPRLMKNSFVYVLTFRNMFVFYCCMCCMFCKVFLCIFIFLMQIAATTKRTNRLKHVRALLPDKNIKVSGSARLAGRLTQPAWSAPRTILYWASSVLINVLMSLCVFYIFMCFVCALYVLCFVKCLHACICFVCIWQHKN